MLEEGEGKEALFVRLPSSVIRAFKLYCELQGKKQSEALEEVLVAFLQSVGALKPAEGANVPKAILEQFEKKAKKLAGEDEDAYERKKRQLEETRAKKVREFNRLRSHMSAEAFEALREYARACGLKPDPTNPTAPMLESIRPAIRQMLEKYQPHKHKFTPDNLHDYLSFLEIWLKEHTLRREIEEMRLQKYLNPQSI